VAYFGIPGKKQTKLTVEILERYLLLTYI